MSSKISLISVNYSVKQSVRSKYRYVQVWCSLKDKSEVYQLLFASSKILILAKAVKLALESNILTHTKAA